MPEMSTRLKKACTSRTYRIVGGRVVLPWALQGLLPTGTGLEIGAGGGAMAARLLDAFPELCLVVTDHDPEMVATARRTLAPFGSRADVSRADAAALPFDDGRFDLVASFGMLHHVVGWQQALAEAVRVLRPGGRLVCYDVLDALPARWAHRIGRTGEITMFGADRLATELAALPLSTIRIRRSTGGMLVRFTGTAAGWSSR